MMMARAKSATYNPRSSAASSVPTRTPPRDPHDRRRREVREGPASFREDPPSRRRGLLDAVEADLTSQSEMERRVFDPVAEVPAYAAELSDVSRAYCGYDAAYFDTATDKAEEAREARRKVESRDADARLRRQEAARREQEAASKRRPQPSLRRRQETTPDGRRQETGTPDAWLAGPTVRGSVSFKIFMLPCRN
jgi:hypothetical protein